MKNSKERDERILLLLVVAIVIIMLVKSLLLIDKNRDRESLIVSPEIEQAWIQLNYLLAGEEIEIDESQIREIRAADLSYSRNYAWYNPELKIIIIDKSLNEKSMIFILAHEVLHSQNIEHDSLDPLMSASISTFIIDFQTKYRIGEIITDSYKKNLK